MKDTFNINKKFSQTRYNKGIVKKEMQKQADWRMLLNTVQRNSLWRHLKFFLVTLNRKKEGAVLFYSSGKLAEWGEYIKPLPGAYQNAAASHAAGRCRWQCYPDTLQDSRSLYCHPLLLPSTFPLSCSADLILSNVSLPGATLLAQWSVQESQGPWSMLLWVQVEMVFKS